MICLYKNFNSILCTVYRYDCSIPHYARDLLLLYVLIDKQDLDLNVTDSKGRTALHWSAQYNRRDVTEVCLEHQQ